MTSDQQRLTEACYQNLTLRSAIVRATKQLTRQPKPDPELHQTVVVGIFIEARRLGIVFSKDMTGEWIKEVVDGVLLLTATADEESQ